MICGHPSAGESSARLNAPRLTSPRPAAATTSATAATAGEPSSAARRRRRAKGSGERLLDAGDGVRRMAAETLIAVPVQVTRADVGRCLETGGLEHVLGHAEGDAVDQVFLPQDERHRRRLLEATEVLEVRAEGHPSR